MREQIEKVLGDLREQKLRAFRSALARFTEDVGFGAFVLQESAVLALDRYASEMVYEAVAGVLPISRTTDAFDQIEQAVGLFFLESSHALERWYLDKLALPFTSIVDTGHTDAVHRLLEKQLSIYRSEFAIGTVVTPAHKGPGGRNRKFDWVTAGNAVWGKLYRADLTPEKDQQVGIEKAFEKHFEMLGEYPGEATIRTYARDIYNEVTRKA